MPLVSAAIDAATLGAIREHLDGDACFVDGRQTAAGLAAEAKHNEQAVESAATTAVLRTVEQRLRAHPVFAAAVRPQQFVAMRLSRYRPGMHYGRHIDDALMQQTRTDLSFSCFISAPEEYDGGELLVHDSGGAQQTIKAGAGDCFVYPAGTVHEVAPVTRGCRVAVVGWVRSQIRDPRQRALLFELDDVLASLDDTASPRDTRLALAHIRGELLRMWVED